MHTGYIDRTNVVLITQCIKKQRDNLERQILLGATNPSSISRYRDNSRNA